MRKTVQSKIQVWIFHPQVMLKMGGANFRGLSNCRLVKQIYCWLNYSAFELWKRHFINQKKISLQLKKISNVSARSNARFFYSKLPAFSLHMRAFAACNRNLQYCHCRVFNFLLFFRGTFFICSNETFVLFLGKGPQKMEIIETFTNWRWTFHK